MKKTIIVFNLILLSLFFKGQTVLKQYKVGNTLSISAPSYMSKTKGLHPQSTVEFKCDEKDLYTIVLVDTKDELRLKGSKVNTLKKNYDNYIASFPVAEHDRKTSTPIYTKKGASNFVEFEITFYDKDSKVNFYYFIGIVETTKAFYRVISWATIESKVKYKADFQKTLYSLID